MLLMRNQLTAPRNNNNAKFMRKLKFLNLAQKNIKKLKKMFKWWWKRLKNQKRMKLNWIWF